jgi:small subunit ribosomal protein S16
MLCLTVTFYSVSIALMLKIRLQRVGRKHEPVFRLVVVDSHRSTKSGKFIEILGNFDSRKGEDAEFKTERIKHWLSKGAKTSDTVHNLFVSQKLIEGEKINVLPKKKPIVKEEKGAKESGGEKSKDSEESKQDKQEEKSEKKDTDEEGNSEKKEETIEKKEEEHQSSQESKEKLGQSTEEKKEEETPVNS